MPVLASGNPAHELGKQPAEPIPSDGTGKTCNWNSRKAADDHLGVVTLDPWLGPYKEGLRSRFSKTQAWIKTIEESEGGLEKFSRVPGLQSHSRNY
jgi:hypothetical protein